MRECEDVIETLQSQLSQEKGRVAEGHDEAGKLLRKEEHLRQRLEEAEF